MKRCPTCSRVYDDMSLRFCLDDGTELVDKPAETQPPVTLVLPEGEEAQQTIKAFQPPPPPPVPPATVTASSSQKKLIIWILVIGLGLPLLAGLLFGAWVMTHRQPLVWHLVLELDRQTPDLNNAVTQTTEIVKSRLNAYGLNNFEVRPRGDSSGQILINLPVLQDPERVKQLITAGGKLELVHLITPPSPMPATTYATREEAIASLNSAGTIPANRRVLPYPEREDVTSTNKSPAKWVVVESPAIINGSDLRTASAVRAYDDDYQIHFSLKKAGAEKFGSWTGAHINEYLGVVLNDEVKSIAYIKSQIFDEGEISGRFTQHTAEDLALVLKAGALPAPVRLIEEKIDK